MTEKIYYDKTKGEVREAVCSRCDALTKHEVCSSTSVWWDEKSVDIQGNDVYEIIRCRGCDQVSFRTAATNSEDMDQDEEGEIFHPEKVELYPSRIMGRTPLKEEHILPEKVRSIYKETHSALCAKLKILAGVGIRALVEAVCSQESAKGRNLEGKIADLIKKEVLTKKNADILQKTRLLGNRAAHETKTPSDEELDVAFDIVENLLETVYIIPKKAERLK
jgi:hypothetical protein